MPSRRSARLGIGDLRLSSALDLTLHRLEVPFNAIDSTESVSTRLKLLVCLAKTGVNTPLTMLPSTD